MMVTWHAYRMRMRPCCSERIALVRLSKHGCLCQLLGNQAVQSAAFCIKERLCLGCVRLLHYGDVLLSVREMQDILHDRQISVRHGAAAGMMQTPAVM